MAWVLIGFYGFVLERKYTFFWRHSTHQCGSGFSDDFAKPKIVWADLSRTGNSFVLDKGKCCFTNTAYMITVPDGCEEELYYLIAFLNSRTILYCMNQISSRLDENGWRWFRQFVELLRIPKDVRKDEIIAVAKTITKENQKEKSEEVNRLVAKMYGFSEEEEAFINQALGKY